MVTRTEEDYEQIAKSWRVKVGVDNVLQIDMLRVFEELKSQRIIEDFVFVPDDFLGGAEGRYDPDLRKVFLRESDRVGVTQRSPRSSFTMAHEMGHIVFKATKARDRSSDPIRSYAPTIRRDERPADRFAAAFLSPYHRSNYAPGTTAQQIAQQFNLSPDAARIRIEEFARIYRRQHGLRRPLPANVVSYLEEARARGRVVTSLPVAPNRDAVAEPRDVPTISETCFVCGWPQVELANTTKVGCPKCKAFYVRFQDGDSAAG